VDLEHVDVAAETRGDLLLLIDDALKQLGEHDSTAAELIKLRFFAGLPNAQAAELLGIPERTAKRTWAYARTWLFQQVQQNV
jgi:DNA-directed RNA polymerase specialized sigma24 family protein